jgi:hypothetical protein
VLLSKEKEKGNEWTISQKAFIEGGSLNRGRDPCPQMSGRPKQEKIPYYKIEIGIEEARISQHLFAALHAAKDAQSPSYDSIYKCDYCRRHRHHDCSSAIIDG